MNKQCTKLESIMGKNKHGKKKQYLSNVDVPLSKTEVKVVKSNATETVENLPKSILKPSTSGLSKPQASSDPSKYEQPELYSTLAVSKQIEAIKKEEPPSQSSAGQLTPNSKKQFNTKITKQLNHQPDINVFKKLTPVNVNDSMLLPTAGRRPSQSTNPKYEFKDKKDPEPLLSDYLMPTVEPYEMTHDLGFPLYNVCKLEDNFENIKYVMDLVDKRCVE